MTSQAVGTNMVGYQRSVAGEANGQVDSSGVPARALLMGPLNSNSLSLARRDSLRWGEALRPGGLPPAPPGEELPPWPEGHPLPLPQWGPREDSAGFGSVEEYEQFAAYVELTEQQLLQAHQYNTTGNLIRFYDEWKKSGEVSVKDFYRKYKPPITAEHYTCVGLGLELMRRLQVLANRFPATKDKFYLVSCEESIDHLQGYIDADPCAGTCEKEHVLVALRIQVQGRPGLLLLDPGYHVARAVTVMQDNTYPHTGWFTQSEEPGLRKDYSYSMTDNPDYVVWREQEVRGGVKSESESVVYIARPYLTPVTVTERRNLVYNFRSWLARDTKGHLLAGLYFPVKEGGQVTLFYQDSYGVKHRLRVDPTADNNQAAVAMERVSTHFGIPLQCLKAVLTRVGTILHDHAFLRETLELNRDITGVSLGN